MQQLGQIAAVSDPAELEQFLAGLEGQRGQLPPEMQPAFAVMERAARQRIDQLKSGAAAGKEE